MHYLFWAERNQVTRHWVQGSSVVSSMLLLYTVTKVDALGRWNLITQTGEKGIIAVLGKWDRPHPGHYLAVADRQFIGRAFASCTRSNRSSIAFVLVVSKSYSNSRLEFPSVFTQPIHHSESRWPSKKRTKSLLKLLVILIIRLGVRSMRK